MRRLAVALVAVTVALSLAGCGGGGEEEAAAPETAPAPAAAAQPAAAEEATGPAVDVLSPLEGGYEQPFPVGGDVVIPDAVQQRLDAGQPFLLYYYDADQQVTIDQTVEVDAVMGEYRGLIDLISYDVDSELLDSGETPDPDDPTRQAYELAATLGADQTPYLVLVDARGVITWRWRGFVTREPLKREVLYATQLQ
jgi:hypothetical protein